MKNKKIKFIAVGDIALGDHPLCVGFGAHSKFNKLEATFPFEKVLAEFDTADVLFGNMECPLSDFECRGQDYKAIQMRGDSKYAMGMMDAGFNVVNMANNHSMQHGSRAFLETVQLLNNHGIKCCGIRAENQMHSQACILEINGLRLAFLGYSLRPRQYFEYEPLYAEGTMDGITNDLYDIRRKVDKIIVSLHWGDEFIAYPSPAEINMGRRIIDAGADLIIGHHPHVVRGIERYKRGVIVYSLGNFVCDMVWDDSLRESVIFQCNITHSGIEDIELRPVFINDNYQPEVLTGQSGEALLSKVNRLSDELQHENVSRISEKLSEYQKTAREINRLYRSKSHRYFLSKIGNYPARILMQQIMVYLRNRKNEYLNK